MTTPPSHHLGECLHALAPIGRYLTDTAARLAYMRDLLPPLGPLTEEYRELVTTLTYLETAYRDADEELLARFQQLRHDELVPHPKPPSARMLELAENQAHAGPTDTMQATRVGEATPAHRPTSVRT